jgi:glyoxylase-like metal-dependent hydrolase (beta-lactamase superfamily II)
MVVRQPYPNVLAFYDGRFEGQRAYAERPNWLDDGAYGLGVCSYAIVDGEEALVYDTHISLAHARIIRGVLEARGVRSIRVVLSHWHIDHVAGNEVFADCEIIANRATEAALIENRRDIESDDPPIAPLILPNRIFDTTLTLQVGSTRVDLRQADIHSHDATLLLLPETGLLFAGDALEDPITYVAEPDRLAAHLADLRRIAGWDIGRILPNHGAAGVIAAGGYGAGLIEATRLYVGKLLRLRAEPHLAGQDLQGFAPDAFATGAITYFAPYEAVHRRNVEAVLA